MYNDQYLVCCKCGKTFHYNLHSMGKRWAMSQYKFKSIGKREFCDSCYRIRSVKSNSVPGLWWYEEYFEQVNTIPAVSKKVVVFDEEDQRAVKTYEESNSTIRIENIQI